MASPNIKKRSINTIILVDKHQPQIFKFDEPPIFGEQAIKRTLSAELIIDQNTLLNIDTSLFYAKKIYIVAPRTDCLIKGQIVHLNLSDFYQELAQEYFLTIPCLLEKVEKHQHVVHAILTFTENTSSQFNHWYQQWFNKHQEKNQDNTIDENSFKFIYQYYKRLNAAHLTTPLLLSNSQQIIHAFTSNACNSDITFSTQQAEKIPLPLSLFQPHITHQEKTTRIPLYVWYENNKIHYFSNKDYPHVSSKQIISWLIKKPMWRVLLLHNHPITPPTKIQIAEIKQYVSEQAITDNTEFIQSFSEIKTMTEIINISGLFTHISLPDYNEVLLEKEHPSNATNAYYQSLSFQVKRAEYRFPYKTALEFSTINATKNITIKAESSDISFLGLSLTLPVAEYPIKAGDLISIDFTEWNANQPKSIFKKKEILKPTEYEITNIITQTEQITLGLKRIKRDTEPKINTYIRNVLQEIEHTHKGSIHNNYDLYQSLYASLWINNNITGLKFFLGRDKQGIRIIQAIASTQKNLKICTPYLENNDWSFLQQIALSLDIAINECNGKNKIDKSLNIGLYSYYDELSSPAQWHTKTDLDFKSTQSKAQFIQTAQTFKKHSFYHCSLVLITPGKDDILKGESSSFVSLAAHRLKEIHEICRALIAIGELNDVTRLISFMYK